MHQGSNGPRLVRGDEEFIGLMFAGQESADGRGIAAIGLWELQIQGLSIRHSCGVRYSDV